MKKLKIILPIFLISLFFIPSVKALSTDYNYEVKYSETNLSLQSQYSTEIQLIKDYVINQGGIGSYQFSTGDYLLMIRTDQISNNDINVQLVNVDSSSTARSYYFNNQYGISGAVNIGITAYQQRYSINNGVVTPLNSANQVGSNYNWNIDTSTCNPNNADCTLYDNTHYFDTFDINDGFTFQLVDYTQGVTNGKNTPLLLSNYNNSVYVVGENVSYKHFFDNLSSPDNSFTCDLEYLGSTTNVSSYTFRVTGTTNVLSEPLEGNIVLTALGLDTNSFSGNVNNLVVNVNEGPSIDEDLFDIQYDLKFEAPNIILHYIITPEDDIDSYADITFTLLYNDIAWEDFFDNKVEIRACQPYHGILTYGYRDRTTGITNSTDSTLMNWLNNSSSGDFTNLIQVIQNAPAGPVDGIITMPLVLLQSLVNKLSTNTCAPLNLPIPFITGGNLVLPCISTLYSKINGLSTFLNWFSGIFSAFLLYKYFIFLFKWVDDTLTLRENNHFGGY